ncbi:hypothetical protein AWC16_01300 [Mycolicibacter longobardus]|uniref:Uncharacterized protein n=1 Tax=Mycolicibacter longobardus TaxID=1108812 RepID=A0A1X1Y6B7_9MYCO|nr:hypothetical protein AWC16_01300 [Mycolicibacter longobardus]
MDTSLATRLIAAVDASPDCTARRQIAAAAASAARRRRPVSVEQLAGSAGLSVDQVPAELAALTDTGSPVRRQGETTWAMRPRIVGNTRASRAVQVYVPNGTHRSVHTRIEMFEISTGPVIYSHSCMRAV